MAFIKEVEKKWVEMSDLERIETILKVLSRRPETQYQIYRQILGCDYRSLRNYLAECVGRGFITAKEEVRFGVKSKVYSITERGHQLLKAASG